MASDRTGVRRTLENTRRHLLELRHPSGHWEGELAGSALSTATAVYALATAEGRRSGTASSAGSPSQRTGNSLDSGTEHRIRTGLGWLAAHQNADGGWGDTVFSPSNLSTTALCWAALALAGGVGLDCSSAADRARAWLTRQAGGLEPDRLARAIAGRYGNDRTFSVPILTMCALAGRLGDGREAWRWVRPLPFELAAFPQRWYRWLRLPVVSYALPALIAMGQVHHHHRPSRNPVLRLLRDAARQPTLRLLEELQPSSGGFLEAVPLTGFVVMSLAAAGEGNHPVVGRGLRFLEASARSDGSWPIDTNLATWVTTLSVNALALGRDFTSLLGEPDRKRIADWLLDQQHREVHAYTGAAPGGWAWTDLPGGVPDADDTAGALLALRNLRLDDERILESAAAGVKWLIGLQNRDGGIPTFCRGWGKLPFDRSGADLTAHALSALAAWRQDLSPALLDRADEAIQRGLSYLVRVQRGDGSWVPLWFGNEEAPGGENPTYGTARVLMALKRIEDRSLAGTSEPRSVGILWLLWSQNADGGWGGAAGAPSSIEETALAVEALAAELSEPSTGDRSSPSPGGPLRKPGGQLETVLRPEMLRAPLERGVGWLVENTEEGRRFTPSPIGLYFAKLYYFEKLYPVITTLAALERAGPFADSRR